MLRDMDARSTVTMGMGMDMGSIGMDIGRAIGFTNTTSTSSKSNRSKVMPVESAAAVGAEAAAREGEGCSGSVGFEASAGRDGYATVDNGDARVNGYRRASSPSPSYPHGPCSRGSSDIVSGGSSRPHSHSHSLDVATSLGLERTEGGTDWQFGAGGKPPSCLLFTFHLG